MEALLDSLQGQALHRAVDALMCEAMRSLGYGEGVALFEKAVEGYHQ
jgi:hypothetical protein